MAGSSAVILPKLRFLEVELTGSLEKREDGRLGLRKCIALELRRYQFTDLAEFKAIQASGHTTLIM